MSQSLNDNMVMVGLMRMFSCKGNCFKKCITILTTNLCL